MLEFSWDSNKATANLKKHGVTFNEASTVFGDTLSVTAHDSEHSHEEARLITMGVSDSGKTLVVTHTDRRGAIRIISARKATSHERKFYEEKP